MIDASLLKCDWIFQFNQIDDKQNKIISTQNKRKERKIKRKMKNKTKMHTLNKLTHKKCKIIVLHKIGLILSFKFGKLLEVENISSKFDKLY